MRLALSLTLVCLFLSHLIVADTTQGTSIEARADSLQQVSTPPCFLQCAAQSSTKVNCIGATDLACYCAKQDFMKANAKCTMLQCPDLAMNTTLTTASFQQLATMCKQAVGSFNLTIPTAADLGMSNETQTTNTAATPASASAAKPQSGQQPAVDPSSSSSSSSAASYLPPMACLVPMVIAVSTVLAGVTLLM